jgi:adenylyltransferase/sulfurtransferase
LLDVREPNEREICALPHSINIPLGELAARMSELQTAAELVVYCRSGKRSALALEQLTRAGFSNVKNLKGGIVAWAKDVDPQMPYY